MPPYGSEGALYLRPLLFGSGARRGVGPSDEYTLLVMAVPVRNCYKVRRCGEGRLVDARAGA